MCIGLPLQVLAIEPGHAVCDDGGTPRRVRTALVAGVDGLGLQPGDWLLVFIDSAIERLTPDRAAEIRHTLALLAGALDHPAPAASADAGFDLPSRWTMAQLQALAGQPATTPHPESAA